MIRSLGLVAPRLPAGIPAWLASLALIGGCSATQVPVDTGFETSGSSGSASPSRGESDETAAEATTSGDTGSSTGGSGSGSTSGGLGSESTVATNELSGSSSGEGSSSTGADDSTSSSGTPLTSTSFADTGDDTGAAQVRVSGVVRAGVAPGGDGIGTVYIGLRPEFDCFDGTTQFNDVIAAADLSVIGNEVVFSIDADLVELDGDQALQVFLDDNDDAADDNDPGDNDMIIDPPVGNEELAGCHALGEVDGNIDDAVVVLDAIY